MARRLLMSAMAIGQRPKSVGFAVSRRSRPKILVVEDHDETRDFLAMLLQTEGYEVVLAADGDAGIARARAAQPDIAIVDIFLPRTDGVAVIEALRRDLPGLSIVAVSADAGVDRRSALARAREAGAHFTLRKPLEPWVLLRALDGIVEGVA